MRRYFAAIGEKANIGQGWPLAIVSGRSISNNKDWSIETLALKADEVPEVCADACMFSQLVAGLLNLYYNDLETKGRTEEQVMKLGDELAALDIPHPANPCLPFPSDTNQALYETRLILVRLLHKMNFIARSYTISDDAKRTMEQAKEVILKYSNIKDVLR